MEEDVEDRTRGNSKRSLLSENRILMKLKGNSKSRRHALRVRMLSNEEKPCKNKMRTAKIRSLR